MSHQCRTPRSAAPSSSPWQTADRPAAGAVANGRHGLAWIAAASPRHGLAAVILAAALGLTPPHALAEAPPDPARAPGTERALEFPSRLAPPPDVPAEPHLSSLTSGPRGPAVTACARKCVPGCVRGGAGGPGLGPLTLRRDPVVFSDGYRSRVYCLNECTRVCAVPQPGVGR